MPLSRTIPAIIPTLPPRDRLANICTEVVGNTLYMYMNDWMPDRQAGGRLRTEYSPMVYCSAFTAKARAAASASVSLIPVATLRANSSRYAASPRVRRLACSVTLKVHIHPSWNFCMKPEVVRPRAEPTSAFDWAGIIAPSRISCAMKAASRAFNPYFLSSVGSAATAAATLS